MHDSIGHREPYSQVMLLLLLVVLVFTVPIRLVIPTPGPEFRRGLVCAMELVFIVPYVMSLARRENFVVLSPVAGSMFLLWTLASIVSIVFAAHWLPALARQFEWMCHILFAASIWHLLRQNRMYARWAITFAIAGSFVTTLVVFLAWSGDPANADLHWRQYLPLFTHIRHFGYYVLAGLLLAQLWGADARSSTPRVILALPILCVFWGALIWTGGRAALASALVGIGVVAVFAAGRRWTVIGMNTVAISVGSVVAVIMSSGRPELGWRGIVTRLGAEDVAGFATGRLKFWDLAFDSFVQSPLFGLGPDAYRFLEPKIFGSHPHNVLLQFITDYGVIGTAGFGLLAVVLFVTTIRRATEPRADLRAERIVSVAVVVAYAANALLDGTFYHATPLMVLAVVTAIGLVPESYVSASRSAGLFAIRTGFAGIAVSIVACFFATYIAVLSCFVFTTVPSPDDLRAKLVRYVPLATNSMALESWIRAWGREDLATATEWAHWAHENSPDAYRFRSLEAQLLADQGLYDAARQHARDALDSSTGRTRMAVAESLKPIIQAAEANSGQMLFQVPGE